MSTKLFQNIRRLYSGSIMALLVVLRSLSIIAPICLLPCALMIPESALNHRKLAISFTTLIFVIHGFNLCFSHKFGDTPLQLIAVSHSLWTLDVLVWRDPRKDFKLIHRTSAKLKHDSPAKPVRLWQESYPQSISRRAF